MRILAVLLIWVYKRTRKKIVSYYPRLAKYHFQKNNNTLVSNSSFSELCIKEPYTMTEGKSVTE